MKEVELYKPETIMNLVHFHVKILIIIKGKRKSLEVLKSLPERRSCFVPLPTGRQGTCF
jgi:hypothetical protein